MKVKPGYMAPIPLNLNALEDSDKRNDVNNKDNVSRDDSPQLIHDTGTRNEEAVAPQQHDIRPAFYQLYEKVINKLASAVQMDETGEEVDFYKYLQKWFDATSELEDFDPSAVDCTHIQQQLDYFDVITSSLAGAKLKDDDTRLRMYNSELRMMIKNCKRSIPIPTLVPIKLEEDQYGCCCL